MRKIVDMSTETQEQKPWLERLKHTYRLVIMNNETFEEIGSYRITLLNVYILLSTLFVVMFTVVLFMIAVTPIKRYLPGYVAGGNEAEIREMGRRVDSLGTLVEAYELYTQNFRKILVGEGIQTEHDVDQTVDEDLSLENDSAFAELAASDVDRQLRQEIELEEIGQAVQQSRTTNISPKDLPLEQMYFMTPVSGEISAAFTPDDNKHYGVDVLAAKNTAIKAAMDGYVFISDWTLETGNTIGIQHTNNIITFYKHNSALLKRVGSYVKAGEAIAIIGNTGTLSDGPHLHFELWHKGKPVDPTLYIKF
jgi:murein DD-endopeptidase MepM/ murein hydrolase activator NlpD